MNDKYDYLNDEEKAKIAQFNSDEVMKEAVRKVLLETVYQRGALKKGKKANALENLALVYTSQHPDADDAELGRHQRALFQGINYVELGFNKLSEFTTVHERPSKKINQAR